MIIEGQDSYLVKIQTDNPGEKLVRETFSKGVINTDKNGYQKALSQHQAAKAKLAAEAAQEQRISRLEESVSFIKDALTRLLKQNNA